MRTIRRPYIYLFRLFYSFDKSNKVFCCYKNVILRINIIKYKNHIGNVIKHLHSLTHSHTYTYIHTHAHAHTRTVMFVINI